MSCTRTPQPRTGKRSSRVVRVTILRVPMIGGSTIQTRRMSPPARPASRSASRRLWVKSNGVGQLRCDRAGQEPRGEAQGERERGDPQRRPRQALVPGLLVLGSQDWSHSLPRRASRRCSYACLLRLTGGGAGSSRLLRWGLEVRRQLGRLLVQHLYDGPVHPHRAGHGEEEEHGEGARGEAGPALAVGEERGQEEAPGPPSIPTRPPTAPTSWGKYSGMCL